MDLTLLLPLALLVIMMVFMWRSNKKRNAQQQELRSKIQPGVEVMTQSGIFGTLVSVDEESNVATVETSPGVLLRVHKATIANVVEPTVEVPNDASSLTGDADRETADSDAYESTSSADSNAADAADSNSDSTDSSDSTVDEDNSNEDRPKA